MKIVPKTGILLMVFYPQSAAVCWLTVRRLAFVADFGTQNFHLKTNFDMENKTSTNHEIGNDANRLLAVRLIAEFMGWKSFEYDHLTNKVHQGDYGKHLDNFSYSTSWDELMPVVKKIQQLQIDDFTKKKPVMSALMDVEIESLFNAVVVFLQWWSKADR